MFVDTPTTGQTVSDGFAVAGWALDARRDRERHR